MCRFIRSDSVVAESAVVDWLPGPDSSVDIEFVWTPIHGRLGKSDLIKMFFSDVESNLTNRFDFIEPATKNQLEDHVTHVLPGFLVRLLPRSGANIPRAGTNSRFNHHRRLEGSDTL